MKTWFFLAFFQIFLALESSSVVAAPRTMPLQQAIEYALEHSPGVSTAKKLQQIRELEYSNAVAQMLPSLDLKTSHGLQNNIPIGQNFFVFTPNPSAPYLSSLNLGITEKLYDNGVSLTQIKIAELNRDLALAGYLKARDSLVLDVLAEFYRFSLGENLFKVRKTQRSILEKQFRNLTSQYQQGFKPRNDYLRLKTQVERAEIDLTSARAAIDSYVKDLRRLLGVNWNDVEQPLFVALEIEPKGTKITFEPKKPPQVENTYDYRILKIQADINYQNVSLAKRRYWPQLFLQAEARYSNLNYVNSGVPFSATQQLSWAAVVQLDFNLWDWGIRKRGVQVSQLEFEVQQNTVEQTALDTQAKIAGLMIHLSRLNRNYSLVLELLDLENESYLNLETQYQEGKVSYLDLITSLSSLLDAKEKFLNSYFEILQSKAQYKYFEGTIYDALLESV